MMASAGLNRTSVVARANPLNMSIMMGPALADKRNFSTATKMANGNAEHGEDEYSI